MVQTKHLQRHTQRHRRRTATTPHTEKRTTVAGLTAAQKHTELLQNKRVFLS